MTNASPYPAHPSAHPVHPSAHPAYPTAPPVGPFPDPIPQPYHRLDRTTGRHRWWRPLAGTVLLAFAYFVILLVLLALSYGLGTALGAPELPDDGADLGPLGNTAMDLVSIAIALPLVLLATLWPARRRVGTVTSVTGRLRIGWLGRCLLAGLLPILLLTVTSFLLPDDSGDSGTWVGWRSFLTALAVLALLVPLQAAAEEYVFRGWLLQAVGAFVRSPWFAVIPQAVLFAAAHGWGTRWGFLGLLVNGLVAGLLTIRTGGLEAAIALHVLNNLLAFGASAAVVDGLSSDETAADAPWALALTAIVTDLLYAAIVLWFARRHKPQRLSAPTTPPDPRAHPARTA
ncbi:CPBP family intramembrane glutamic endopeptidase [Streptomyces collinus]|uniref:Membrane protease YdiL (CAAX protease family) n=1 Tax=Streptomyces collinus TaxID=42684 RepID=A0AA89Q5G4_STRCU|nr:CPBP family intramembrane glutamic endopeptidase [Streptomyces collinus]MBB5813075.1 membrane protease YdiL (CAAX protease family) [Streptomyces collinus]WMX66198.1 CPBP family intramembrane glutamic endopeptidase [Streptomyces collinus]